MEREVNVPDEVMAELEADILPYYEWMMKWTRAKECCTTLVGCNEGCRHGSVEPNYQIHLCGEEPRNAALVTDDTRYPETILTCPTCRRPWLHRIGGVIEQAHARRAAIIDNIRIALGDIDEATEQAERARLMPV